jgi:GH25 family lysozyme M1 (1,4-beta-N-acetylmuramidase)
MRRQFVDVSENQGVIDFSTTAAAGVENLIPRAGINGRLDYKLDAYVNGARAHGITVPALYWFVNPNSSASAEQQAALAIGACQRYGVRTLMYDLESYASESSKPALSGPAYMAWLERMDVIVRGELNRIVYTNANWWNPLYVGVGSTLTECDLVVATYPRYTPVGAYALVNGYPPSQWEARAFGALPAGPATPAGFDQWDAWQFSAGFNRQGPVYGAQSTDLDLNIVDEEALARWIGDDHYDPQESEMHPMASFLGYVLIKETGGYGGLIIGTDGVLYARDQSGEGAGVFAFTCGEVSQQSYEALPKYDPVKDAQWLGAHLGLAQAGGASPAPKGIDIRSIPGVAAVTY